MLADINGISDLYETVQGYIALLDEKMASAASQDESKVFQSTSRDTVNAFHLFQDTLNTSEQRMKVLRGELGSYQRQTLTYTPKMKVFKWLKQKKDRCPKIVRVMLSVFLILWSKIENKRILVLGYCKIFDAVPFLSSVSMMCSTSMQNSPTFPALRVFKQAL